MEFDVGNLVAALATEGVEALDRAGVDDGDHSLALRRFLADPPTELTGEPVFMAERRDLLPQLVAEAPSQMQALSQAIAAVEFITSWAEYAPSDWADPFIGRMAPGFTVGPRGPIDRQDVAFGCFIVDRATFYPEHGHQAEEVYLIVAGHPWFLGADGWKQLGPGEASVQKPNVIHALRTEDEPMLCFWVWTGDPAAEIWALTADGARFYPPKRWG